MARPKRRGKQSATLLTAKNAPRIASVASSSKPAQNDVLPSMESAGSALQESSGNRLKRRREVDSSKDEDPYENAPSPKRTPTPTLFTVREYRAFREKHPVRPWKERKITGQYSLISVKAADGYYVDTTDFIVKVFYDCRDAEERKLYATFKFGKIEGIIRMRRWGDLPYESGETRRLTPEEYDEACILSSKYWPARDKSEFSLRWRGKECDQRVLDGELESEFTFEDQKSTSPNGFPNMNIIFHIVYDDEIFRIKAMKVADLDSTDTERISSLEQEWQALHNPNPEAKDKIEYEEMGDDGFWPERKRRFPCNRKRKAEYHPFSNGSRMFSGAPVASLTTAPASSKTSGWDASGLYCLECTNRLQPVDTADYCFELHYTTRSPRQLFATFEFGKLKGIMRLCPEKALTSRPEKALSLEEFEVACNLNEKIRPAPSFKQWLSRWRALEDGVLKGGETRAQGQFTIQKAPAELGSNHKALKIAFVMVIDGKHLAFEGFQQAPLDEPGPGFILGEEWQALYSPNWELGQVSTPYQPGSIIQIKHKPQQATASGKAVVQERPDWAWDITGQWTLTANQIMDSIGLPRTTRLTMFIFLANNPRHTKIMRQYWAIFSFGESVNGCMRFCMPTDTGSRATAKEFEDSCMLGDDDWVGPSPTGSTKLQFRFRAIDSSTGGKPSWQIEDYHEGITFKIDDDGKLSFSAVMTVNFQPMLLHGVRVGNGLVRKSNEPTVKKVWDLYKEEENEDYFCYLG